MKQLGHPDICSITLTGVLAALGDPVRLKMVHALLDGERSASNFECGVANSTRSHHLKVLREAGIVSHRKEGTRCFVCLRPELEERFPGLLGVVLGFGGGQLPPQWL